MEALAHIRNEKGLSQRQLAAKASLSFRCVQHLEEPHHNWRISSVRRIAEALGLPSHGIDVAIEHFLSTTIDSVEDISIRIVVGGFNSWKVHLFNFVDAFRSTWDPMLVNDGPIRELDERLRALLASTVEALSCESGTPAPAWCPGIPCLDDPWFVSGIENLKASALAESPAFFRHRNIFVLGNFLHRA